MDGQRADYEPPLLVEVGDFAERTNGGGVGPYVDFPGVPYWTL